jgi:hypothetical protein
MSHSVSATHTQSQPQESTNQPAKQPQPASHESIPQDKVTISESAKQAVANNSKPSTSGDTENESAHH